MTRVLFAAYFLEAGLILIVAPWSAFWDRNFFASRLPIDGVLLSNSSCAARSPGSAASRRWPGSPSWPVFRSKRSKEPAPAPD